MKLLCLGGIFFLSLQAGAAAAEEPQKPNVVVIYTDDQGYGDVSALNPDAKFQTPHIDRLAAEGITFTHGHSADSVCTPSRYALLTGRYPWRTAMKKGVLGAEAPCLIARERMTVASLLKDQGYRTAMVGKWHLGMDFPGTKGDRDWSQPTRDMPLDRGFDFFCGVPASLNFGVLAWFEGRYPKTPPLLFTAKKPNARSSDYRIMPPYTRQDGLEVAADFVDQDCLTNFTDGAIAWLKSSTDGAPFFLYLPYTSPHFPICPRPEFHGQGEAGAYGEFVIETDHHVGRVLACLDEMGVADDTLVLFTSDNGPERVWKPRISEFDHDSRGGLRGGKRSVYEGGHRVPFIVRWPAGIARPGSEWHRPVGQVDLLATLAALLRVELPPDAGEDSCSFATVLTNPVSNASRPPMVVRGNGRVTRYAIIDGDWKLVLPRGEEAAELYDLTKDRSETMNLAARHPAVVVRLTAEINRIVATGRTTKGPSQANDTGYWDGLTWMTPEQYEQLAGD